MVKHVLGDDTGPPTMHRELERRISNARSTAKEHGLILRKARHRRRTDRSWKLLQSGKVLIDHGSIDDVEKILTEYTTSRKKAAPRVRVSMGS